MKDYGGYPFFAHTKNVSYLKSVSSPSAPAHFFVKAAIILLLKQHPLHLPLIFAARCVAYVIKETYIAHNEFPLHYTLYRRSLRRGTCYVVMSSVINWLRHGYFYLLETFGKFADAREVFTSSDFFCVVCCLKHNNSNTSQLSSFVRLSRAVAKGRGGKRGAVPSPR